MPQRSHLPEDEWGKHSSQLWGGSRQKRAQPI